MNESCGCCEGLEPLTPLSIANRPGLNELAYRVGTHATFLETMKARLSSSEFPSLANLKTREANDPAIALLDAWATVADVLTFYQERIANEGYLRTATERRSVLELSRLVGYTLRPGVSATVFPAFMMEIGYNTRDSEVPAGTRIQSVPGPGEMPQFFETADKIAARTDWNEIKPRLTRPLVINKGNALLVETVYLKGITTNLRAGDPLLLTFRFETTDVDPKYPEPEPVLRKVATVEPQPVENFTKVTLQPEPLKYEDFLKAFRQIVIKYSNPSDFCIDERSEDSDIVIGILALLVNLDLTDINKIPPPIADSEFLEKLTTFISNLSFPDLQRENKKIKNPLLLAVFELKKYSVESIWLNRLIAELEKLIRSWYLFLNIPATESLNPVSTQQVDKNEVLSWANWLNKINQSSPQQMLDWYLAWYLAWLLDQYAKQYDLTLIADSTRLSPTGKSQIIVKKTDDYYHIRIFDSEGNQLIDNSKNELLSEAVIRKLEEAFAKRSNGLDDKVKIELKKIIILSLRLLQISKEIPSFDLLSEFVKPLSQSSSIPPANRFRLPRNLGETFSSKSDLRPRLLETLDPRLGSTLYQTLASDDRVPALSLKTPEAMRVKAAPFGHNAPLRPVYTSNGTVEGYREWLIAPTTSIKIHISQKTEEDPPELPVTIWLQLNSQTQNTKIMLRANSSPAILTVNGINVEIEPIGDEFFPLTFTFRFPQPRVFVFNSATASVIIGEIDGDTWRVFPAEVLRKQRNDRQQIITTSESINEQIPSISVLDELPDLVSAQNKKIVTLDAQYDQIQSGSWISLSRPSGINSYRVINTQNVSKSDYGITGRVTQLTLDKDWLTDSDRSLSDLRGITIYAQGEALDLAEEPLTSEPICGQTIELGTIYEGLKAGRWLIVSGDRVDVPNTKASELVMLAGVKNTDPNPPGSKPYSTLTLSTKLAYVYKRDTVKIYGNVVKATHGETRIEVLGSGDGSQAFQQFPLRQPPLTYLASPTPSGAADTLEVRVNDVLWHEADSLADLKPTDRFYTLRTDDNAMTTVIFGNGENGSRLPTGVENVRAVYRSGIGKVGNVKAEQINLLATRPLGLKGVINPLPATGGADRENRDRARENAPLAVMVLDRLVSLQDYEDFPRTFAGIGKASAQRLSDGNRQIIHVTIAGADDIPIDRSSDLYRNLKKTLLDYGDSNQPIRLEVRKLVLLILAAKIRVLPDYQWEVVEPQIRSILLDTFGFERRKLGQSVWLSDIISIIQKVPGVAYVDVDLFNSVSEDDIRTSSTIQAEGELLIDGIKVPIILNQKTNNLVVKLNNLPNHPPQNKVDANLAKIDPKTRIIQPAQLAIFSPKVADTMILTELKP